ncbi:FAD-dependent oxidoreductase [Planomicrobium sp. CPCC 101110]|nr:FAD-dependent oxidoreductase [Planomicrobium sp. CPCC 101110]
MFRNVAFEDNVHIVTPGAAARKILPLIGLQLPLQEIRNTFSWFETDESIYAATDFPAFTFELPEETYYGFPSIKGAGVKIGHHDGGRPRDMEKPIEPFGAYEQDEQNVASFAQQHLPKTGKHGLGKPCTYTITPDENFFIDNHPEHEHVILACGFSGHGFKFSSVVGEILTDMVTGNRQSKRDLSLFSINRFNKG